MRTPLDPTSPAPLFFLLIPPLKPQMGASISSDRPLDTRSPAMPALSTDPPSHSTACQRLPETVQLGSRPLGRAGPAGGEGRPTAHISMATKHTGCPRSMSRKKGTLSDHRNAHTLHPKAASGEVHPGNGSAEGGKAAAPRPRPATGDHRPETSSITFTKETGNRKNSHTYTLTHTH